MTEDEMVDIDVWEFSLDEDEIDEFIEKLQELKQTKTSFNFDVDETNEVQVNYAHSEEDSE